MALPVFFFFFAFMLNGRSELRTIFVHSFGCVIAISIFIYNFLVANERWKYFALRIALNGFCFGLYFFIHLICLRLPFVVFSFEFRYNKFHFCDSHRFKLCHLFQGFLILFFIIIKMHLNMRSNRMRIEYVLEKALVFSNVKCKYLFN